MNNYQTVNGYKMDKGNLRASSILLILIPLALSAYTHFLNPVGFPSPEHDENRYLQRAMNILGGMGPVDSRSSYDAPYFGQIFIAGVLWAIGYPGSLNPTADGDVHSIEILWTVPRLIMSVLAVIDTFLLYKIAAVRYNKYIAFGAAVLFAVMPITWLLRMIWLDSILLPFLLTAVLFASYTNVVKKVNEKKETLLILFSGISLGLAIFTKIPSFTMIPLVSFIIYKNDKRLKILGLWFVPVILIPLIWPAHAIMIGDLDRWLYGINFQTHRTGSSFFDTIRQNLVIDPILLIIGTGGLLYAALKRDFFLLLWILPFVLFSILIGWTQFFHFILILPAFCLAAARLIVDLSSKLSIRKSREFLPLVTISGLAIFGLVTLTIIITGHSTRSYFEVAAFIVQYLKDKEPRENLGYNDTSNNNTNYKVTVISNPFYLWIPKYVFNLHQDYIGFFSTGSIKSQNVVLIVDEGFRRALHSKSDSGDWVRKIYKSYENTIIATIQDVKIISYDVLQPRPEIRALNLINQNHIWKPMNDANISQNNGKLIINVHTNNSHELNNRAILPIQINSTLNKPVIFTLAYSSESTKGQAAYFAEIRDNKLGRLWYKELDNTFGRLAINTFVLVNSIRDGHAEVRINVVTKGPGEHSLTINKFNIM